MRYLARLFAIALLVFAFTGTGHARNDDAVRDHWRKEFAAKRAALIEAQEQLEIANTAQQRRHGDEADASAKVASEQSAAQDARAKVEAAKTEYLKLFEQARKEGAQPGWYRDFEDELPTLMSEEEPDSEAQFPEAAQESSLESAPSLPSAVIHQPVPDTGNVSREAASSDGSAGSPSDKPVNENADAKLP